jgi:hypothetical protein
MIDSFSGFSPQYQQDARTAAMGLTPHALLAVFCPWVELLLENRPAEFESRY